MPGGVSTIVNSRGFRTEHSTEPVSVDQLASACQLTIVEAQAAWRYLRDMGFIETNRIEYTARISARGIDALDKAVAVDELVTKNIGASFATEGSTARGYGRVDSRERLERSRVVSSELVRLHAILPSLTSSELSAYSTKSLPIGTFLIARGHVFSVLTEEMLAQEFKEELERRKGDTTADRWLKRIKNNPVIATVVILGVVIVGIAGVADGLEKLWWVIHPVRPLAPTQVPDPVTATDMDAQLARDLTIQIDLCAFDSEVRSMGKPSPKEPGPRHAPCVTHSTTCPRSPEGVGNLQLQAVVRVRGQEPQGDLEYPAAVLKARFRKSHPPYRNH